MFTHAQHDYAIESLRNRIASQSRAHRTHARNSTINIQPSRHASRVTIQCRRAQLCCGPIDTRTTSSSSSPSTSTSVRAQHVPGRILPAYGATPSPSTWPRLVCVCVCVTLRYNVQYTHCTRHTRTHTPNFLHSRTPASQLLQKHLRPNGCCARSICSMR